MTQGVDTGTSFLPHWWRLMAARLLFLVALCATYMMRFWTDQPKGWIGWRPDGTYEPQPVDYFWLAIPLVMLFIGLVFSLVVGLARAQEMCIDLTSSDVSGPTPHPRWWRGQFGPRESIALSALDRNRSAVRTRMDWLCGRQYLYSLDGARIVLDRWAFGKHRVRLLLGALGIRE